ncbi:MAG: M56 family metallopeptidase [Verrucomicrobiales bacterium]|nr:M56 family metallopeptidase [Verrucomicrobiota bacterium JB025]
MMALLVFSGIAALLVVLAGWRDHARDPLLTTALLGLLLVFPALGRWLPKVELELVAAATGGGGGTLPEWWSWLWSAVCVGFLARLGGAALGLERRRRRAVLVGREDGVEIRMTDGFSGPVAAGVFRKVVFVPVGWARLPAGARRVALDHEMAHHARRDPLWRWLAELALAVHWFNPLVWWMVRRLAAQCEYACDRRVLRSGVDPCDYARLLCDFAEVSAVRGPALSMAERAGLEQRVRRMLRDPSGRVRGGAGVAFAIGLALALAVAMNMVRPTSETVDGFTAEEVELRWSADPFPGE